MSNLETRYNFSGSAEELRIMLIKEVEQRIAAVPNYGDTRAARAHTMAERDGLESLLHMLENLVIGDDADSVRKAVLG